VLVDGGGDLSTCFEFGVFGPWVHSFEIFFFFPFFGASIINHLGHFPCSTYLAFVHVVKIPGGLCLTPHSVLVMEDMDGRGRMST